MTTSDSFSQAVSTSAPENSQRSHERRAAFKVLTDAVAALVRPTGSPATGSAVRLEMKRRTYDGFSPKSLGYGRFRDFLDDAEDQGFIRVDRERPGDVAVTVAGSTFPEGNSGPMMRSDLWKAFSDWNARLSRFYDLREGRVHMIPAEPAPLEPSRYAECREKLRLDPENFVEIKPVSRQQQLEWMRDFTHIVPDGEVSLLLSESLRGEHPAKYFVAVLRTSPKLLSLWHSMLRERIYAEVRKWQDSDPRLTEVRIDRAGGPEDANVASAGESEGTSAWGKSEQPTAVQTVRFLPHRTRNGSSILRDRLHEAIDRMPEAELRKISIPIGYLFEE